MKKSIGFLFPFFWLLTGLYAQPGGKIFFSFDEPLGNVAVTQHRVYPIQYFFSIHPESNSKGPKIFEIEHGFAKPFPDSSFQEKFISPLGVYLDHQNRLWVLDHGKYGFKTAKLFAFNASDGELLLEYSFSKEIVRKFVMLNDLSVTSDGKYIFMSAPGLFKKRSSIIVFDIEQRKARRILTDHPTVMRGKTIPEVDGKKMKFFLGLLKVRPGVDGIDADRQGDYLYYTALSDTVLYRVPVETCVNSSLSDLEIEQAIESVGHRPLCDGIRLDRDEKIYITDFQNHQILSMDQLGEKEVLLKNPDIRWTDGLSLGADGYIYITDSALQYVIMKSEKKYAKHAPFSIWRLKL